VPIEPYAAALFNISPSLLRDLAVHRSRSMRALLRGLELTMTPPPFVVGNNGNSPSASSSGFPASAKLRIGYLSADLKEHSVGRLLQAVSLCVRVAVWLCVVIAW